jgi:hypothetical protein
MIQITLLMRLPWDRIEASFSRERFFGKNLGWTAFVQSACLALAQKKGKYA